MLYAQLSQIEKLSIPTLCRAYQPDPSKGARILGSHFCISPANVCRPRAVGQNSKKINLVPRWVFAVAL